MGLTCNPLRLRTGPNGVLTGRPRQTHLPASPFSSPSSPRIKTGEWPWVRLGELGAGEYVHRGDRQAKKWGATTMETLPMAATRAKVAYDGNVGVRGGGDRDGEDRHREASSRRVRKSMRGDGGSSCQRRWHHGQRCSDASRKGPEPEHGRLGSAMDVGEFGR